MNRVITYGIDRDTGLVVSRVDSELAWPILDWEAMQPENNFATSYNLEKIKVSEVAGTEYAAIKWTKKIPLEIKNLHRQFWGFKIIQ